MQDRSLILLAALLVPGLGHLLAQTPAPVLWHTVLWGALWGIGGLTFGLAVRYLGIVLGYAIALGFCIAFGTLLPPIFSGQIHAVLHIAGGRRGQFDLRRGRFLIGSRTKERCENDESSESSGLHLLLFAEDLWLGDGGTKPPPAHHGPRAGGRRLEGIFKLREQRLGVCQHCRARQESHASLGAKM